MLFLDEALKLIGNAVADVIKEVVGVETFTREYAALQKVQNEKKSSRKLERAQEVILSSYSCF